MIVEFFGLPCTGKTTNMKMLCDRFPDRAEIFCLANARRKANRLRFVCSREYISFFAKTVLLWLGKKKKTRYDIKTLYYYFLLYREMMRLRGLEGDGRLYVADHGLVQNLASLVWDDERLLKKAGKLLEHVAKYFGASVTYIYLCGSDPDELYDRILRRPVDIRLKGFDREAALGIMTRQEELFGKAAVILGERGRAVKIDSSADLEKNFGRICEVLSKEEA